MEFKYLDEVKITGGFYNDCIGVVTGIIRNQTQYGDAEYEVTIVNRFDFVNGYCKVIELEENHLIKIEKE